MRIYEYGEPNAKNVLLQPVGDHDLPAIENEIREIKRLTAQPFRLIAVKVERWNDDLSPWCAPAVFGHEDFGDGAAAFFCCIIAYGNLQHGIIISAYSGFHSWGFLVRIFRQEFADLVLFLHNWKFCTHETCGKLKT